MKLRIRLYQTRTTIGLIQLFSEHRHPLYRPAEMPVRMIEPNPEVKADAGQVVFARGPLVYCLESEDVLFPVEKAMVAPMKPEEVSERVSEKWYPDLLEGIHKLSVPGLADEEEVDLVLIPWFVRASRSDNARWVIHLPQKGRID